MGMGVCEWVVVGMRVFKMGKFSVFLKRTYCVNKRNNCYLGLMFSIKRNKARIILVYKRWFLEYG